VWPNRNIHCYVNWGSFWFISFVVANNVSVPIDWKSVKKCRQLYFKIINSIMCPDMVPCKLRKVMYLSWNY
jgi:hypothetical protein